jgi:signal transduction histidine kinase
MVTPALDERAYLKAWLEALSASVREGVVLVDPQGAITYFSPGAERLTGWSARQVLGDSLSRVFQVPEQNGFQFAALLESPGVQRMDILTRQRTPLTLSVIVKKLPARPEMDPETLLVLRELSDQEAADHLQSIFLANVTHEFRTPLSAINASVEYFLEEMENLTRDEIKQLLQSVNLSFTALQTLIDNLLEASNIEAGRFVVHLRAVDLEEIVTQSASVVAPLLSRRGQRLLIHKPERLPRIEADPLRLEQVLVNLLSNASKYGPVQQTIELTIDAAQQGMLHVAVADRGPGIPPAAKPNLFRRFVHLDTKTGSQYGVGLGLSLVKAIIEEHGGQVGVQDRPGGGAIFWFTVPVARET